MDGTSTAMMRLMRARNVLAEGLVVSVNGAKV